MRELNSSWIPQQHKQRLRWRNFPVMAVRVDLGWAVLWVPLPRPHGGAVPFAVLAALDHRYMEG